jgi:hypothetical protein
VSACRRVGEGRAKLRLSRGFPPCPAPQRLPHKLFPRAISSPPYKDLHTIVAYLPTLPSLVRQTGHELETRPGGLCYAIQHRAIAC